MVKMLRYGTDSSGRAILATPLAVRRLDGLIAACEDAHRRSGGRVPNFTPVIVQGAFMATLGGGAAASAGYHDAAGTYDFRVWNLTADQLAFLIREARRRAIALWHRDRAHGNMDPHAHGVILDDAPLSPGAVEQRAGYIANGGPGSAHPGDGLSHGGHDYHWRPQPLVTSYDDTPKPSPTPNVTAALGAKTRAARKAALRQVVAHGSPKSQAAARGWLASILTYEAAEKKARAAAAVLRGQEVK